MRINQVLDNLYPAVRVLQTVAQQALVVLGPKPEESLHFFRLVVVFKELIDDFQVEVFTEPYQK